VRMSRVSSVDEAGKSLRRPRVRLTEVLASRQ
jgi:hypothetical protein